MYWPLFQLIVALSAGACALLWLHRPVKPVLGFVATGGWLIVALQSRNITAYPNGTEIAVDSVAFQYLAASLALLSLATVILWFLGVYPPVTEREAGRADIHEEAT